MNNFINSLERNINNVTTTENDTIVNNMETIKNCHYCNSKAKLSVHEGLNFIGEKGYLATIRCTQCHNEIERFSKEQDIAIKKVINNWNYGKDI